MANFPRAFQSTAAVAAAVFLLLNCGLGVGAALNSKAMKSSDQNGVLQTIDSGIQQFKLSKRQDVVLLGSSLVMAPVWTADFKKLGLAAVGSFYTYHKFDMLAKALSQHRREPLEVFSFAVPGAMVSDMYLVVEKLLANEKAPALVIYGVAPRDFMDDLAAGETKTAVFQRLGDVSDLNNSDFAKADFDEKLELVMDRGFYLFGKRLRYQAKVDQSLRKLADRRSADAKSGDVFATTAGVFPLLQDPKILWRKSVDEYHMRYQKFNQHQFTKQEQFLRDTLSTCNKRGIQVLLVNMPLTQTNLELMPAGLYDKYLQSVTAIAKENSVALLDLSADKFGNQCFYDTVHLNEVGAKVLLGKLTSAIRDDSGGRLTASVAEKAL
jgi:hypothetical protein